MTRRKAIYNEATGTGYLPGAEATFKFISEKKSGSPGAQPSQVKLEKENYSGKWAYWGADNDFPQKVISDAYKVSAAPAALGFKIKAHYGTGLILYKIEYDEKGKELIKPQTLKEHPEIKEFNKRNKIKRFFRETISDFVWFFNVFPEMIVSRDFSKVTSIRPLEAAFCRWAEMDDNEKRITMCGFSAHWPEEKNIEEIHVIDPWWSVEETREYLRKKKIWKFIYPTYFATPGKSYYQEANWNAARKSGWFDVSAAIPDFKKNLMKNQMTIKWHVEIPLEHWEKLFPKSEYDKKARKEKIEEKLAEMDDFLADTKNTGKTFYSHFAVDQITKQALPGWKITALDNKLSGGEYLEDSQAANSEIMFSMQVDPSLIGHGMPGGKLGAGSGSDKREAFLIYNALLKPDRDVVLEPLEFIRDFNGWDDDLLFGFGDIKLTTLDKNPTGKEKTITA